MKTESGLTLRLDGDDAHCVSLLFQWLLTEPECQIKIDADICFTTRSISEYMLDKFEGAATDEQ